jgi:hypothetical protein
MKNIRPKIATVVTLTAFILFVGSAVIADTVTLTVGGGAPLTESFEVPSNVVAQVIYTDFNTGNNNSSAAYLYVTLPPATTPLNFFAASTPAIVFVGPATMTLTNTRGGSFSAFCTIQTSPASAASFTPSSSVVIPNDGAGPVTIILESSTDLINWTAANPGTYGTTSSNRFFRVRAQR